MQTGREWADRRLSMVGGGGGLAPLENEKKILSEEILTSFTYVLLMKLGGRSIHFTCKIKEGGRTGACPWWVWGGGAMGLCPPRK